MLESKYSLESAMTDLFFKDAIFTIQSHDIESIWLSDDSIDATSRLLYTYFDEYKDKKGIDLQEHSQYENRYENAEMQWLASYIVSNLVFLKSDLCLTDSKAIALVLHVMWEALEPFNVEVGHGMESDMQCRFDTLRAGMSALYATRVVNKDQIIKCIEYMRRTLFGHL